MRSVAYRLAAWIALSLAGASAATAAETRPPLTPYAAAPEPDAAETTEGDALAMSAIDLRMAVDVMIDGAGPFRFIVDTGANRTVVSRQLATLLALPAAGRASLHSTNGTSRVDLARIGHMRLGEIEAGPIEAPMLEEAHVGAAGILGLDVLADKQVVIDLRAGTIIIAPSARRISKPVTGDEIVVTARRRHGQLILVDAAIDGQRIDVVLDTGTDTTLGNLALRERLGKRAQVAMSQVTMRDVAGIEALADAAELPTIRIGGIELIGAPAAFVDAHAFGRFGLLKRPALLLGMDLLRNFDRIVIDFGSKTVRFRLAR